MMNKLKQTLQWCTSKNLYSNASMPFGMHWNALESKFTGMKLGAWSNKPNTLFSISNIETHPISRFPTLNLSYAKHPLNKSMRRSCTTYCTRNDKVLEEMHSYNPMPLGSSELF